MSFIFSTAQLTEIQRLFGIADQRNANGNQRGQFQSIWPINQTVF
ncbi:hypothetical protein B0F87_103135 [Methylobacter tundripaludum]|uniref:Uncharacterized protein n=1 Tax=Methylobacter tundripaludum TaxID=173365 RepID=A0A2S6HGC1_9GAMM|nr:hypothetical protein B0F87_103135 [Methylobacter tundripaludum]